VYNLPVLVRPTAQGIFLERLNRFSVSCLVQGQKALAYLPNPGRLWELLLPGRRLLLGPGQRLPFTVLAARRGPYTVALHTGLSNRVFEALLGKGALPGLQGWRVLRREFPLGGHRIDFLLQGPGDRRLLLEVKSCTLFHRALAMFPDAVTLRGRRHLLALASREYHRAGVVFLVQSGAARWFLPDFHTDLGFSSTLYALRKRLLIKAYALCWSPQLRLRGLKEIALPWDIFEAECRDDQGALLALFRQEGGFLLQVLSAPPEGMQALHGRLRRRGHLLAFMPIRAAKPLKGRLLRALERVFGTRAQADAFPLGENPLGRPEFIRLLLEFRMGRLGRRLSADSRPP